MGVQCYDNSKIKLNEKENKIVKIKVPSTNLVKLIKSKYIFEQILSFLKMEEILNLIIYNKYLQKYLDINIDNYKKISGKYKIGEKNGKGKEYTYNYYNGKKEGLIFEGEYLNGKRMEKEKNIIKMVN